MNKLLHGISLVFFSLPVGFVLAFQRVTNTAFSRKLVRFFFGRILASRYHRFIALYGSRYGLALNEGLDEVQAAIERPIRTIIDCGTGTGFVSCALSERFPEARLLSVDAVPEMLHIAGGTFEKIGVEPGLVCADTARLPLGDGCADLIVAQNTMPFLGEFGRVCAPGGAVLFVDSASALVTGIGIRAFRKTNMFDEVVGRPAAAGFFVLGRRKLA